MKKASKIWKIVHTDYPFEPGDLVPSIYSKSYYYGDQQFIFENELDCLLDIVTMPENQGLKVYKHTTREVHIVDEGSKIEIAGICPIEYKNSEWDHYNPHMKFQTREYIENLEKGTYVFDNRYSYMSYYKSTTEYWVDAYMQ